MDDRNPIDATASPPQPGDPPAPAPTPEVDPPAAAEVVPLEPASPAVAIVEEEDDDGKDELPGVFLGGTLLFQCLACASVIEVTIENSMAGDVVDDGRGLEQRLHEVYDADCPECSKGHPAAVPFMVPAGFKAVDVVEVLEGMSLAVEEQEQEQGAAGGSGEPQ